MKLSKKKKNKQTLNGKRGFRPNVGLLLCNRRGELWMGRRAVRHPYLDGQIYAWQCPQGGVDAGESPEKAMFRELYEETGVTTARLLAVTPGWLYYRFPPYIRDSRHRGQKQKWGVLVFQGEEEEISLDNQAKPEFDAWRWMRPEQVVECVVPFKKEVYREVLTGFSPLLDFIADSNASARAERT